MAISRFMLKKGNYIVQEEHTDYGKKKLEDIRKYNPLFRRGRITSVVQMMPEVVQNGRVYTVGQTS
jgi:hypothetical protein